MRGIIYKYTNILNDKCYIGQTTNEQNRRNKWFNLNEKYGGKKINNARKKYGVDVWDYEILFEIESFDKNEITDVLNQMEQYYISLYDSHNKRI